MKILKFSNKYGWKWKDKPTAGYSYLQHEHHSFIIVVYGFDEVNFISTESEDDVTIFATFPCNYYAFLGAMYFHNVILPCPAINPPSAS